MEDLKGKRGRLIFQSGDMQWRSQDFSFRGAEGVLEPSLSLDDFMR